MTKAKEPAPGKITAIRTREAVNFRGAEMLNMVSTQGNRGVKSINAHLFGGVVPGFMIAGEYFVPASNFLALL